MLYDFFSIFDVYGICFYLRYHNHVYYKTTLGAIFGLLSILSIIILSIFFFQDLFLRTNFSVITNDLEDLPLIDLSSSPFLFKFGDASSHEKNNQYDDSVFNFSIQIHSYYNNNSSVTQRSVQEIQMETCDRAKHFKDFGYLFNKINVSSYKCIVPHQNITLFNRFGDTKNGFQIMNLYINKCDESIHSDCLSETVINTKIANSYLSFLYGTYNIDHYNYSNPIHQTIRGELFRFTSSNIKRYFYKMSQSKYMTDTGLVFNDFKEENLFEFNSFYVDIDTDRSLFDKTSIGSITFSCNDSVLLYKRTYPKAQTIIASISSLANLISVLCQIIVKLLTKKMIIANVSNEILLNKESQLNSSSNSGDSKSNIGLQLSIKDSLIKRKYTFTTVSPRMIRKNKTQIESYGDLNVNSDKITDDQLNHSQKVARNYKLKIKKEGGNESLRKVTIEEKEKEKRSLIKRVSLNFFELFVPKVFNKNNKKAQKYYQIEASLFKYLSIENMIPLMEKIDIVWNNTLAKLKNNESYCNSSDNSNVSSNYYNHFQPKFTFA